MTRSRLASCILVPPPSARPFGLGRTTAVAGCLILAAGLAWPVPESPSLAGSGLPFSRLSGASLAGMDLRGATFENSDLGMVNLSGADLRGAVLYGTNLSGANLSGADLREADLTHALMFGTNLAGARLQGARLHAASMLGANLRGADCRSALFDARTEWPDGFDAEACGAQRDLAPRILPRLFVPPGRKERTR